MKNTDSTSIQIPIQQRFNVFIPTSVRKIVKHTSKILQEMIFYRVFDHSVDASYTKI